MQALDKDGKEVKPMTLLGTHKGALWVGCFSAGISLEGGPRLLFNHPGDVPKELRPKLRAHFVPVEVKVYLNELEQIVYDAERTGPDYL